MKIFYTFHLDRFFLRRKISRRLLHTFLFVMGLFFLHSETYGHAMFRRDSWSNSDRYWSVSYDANSGKFTVHVLLYDSNYGPAKEDGFVDYAHLQYSTDNGNTYNDFFYMDYNSGPTQKEMGSRGGMTTSYNIWDDGNEKYANITLAVQNSITSITNIRIVGLWDVNGAYGSDQIDANKSVSFSKLNSLRISKYFFNEDGTVALTWSSDDNTTSDQSYTYLYNESGFKIRETTKGVTSGSFSVDQDNNTVKYRLYQQAYDNRVNLYSDYFAVPAFTHPNGISGKYNPETDKVEITWTIYKATGSDIEKADFKLQRATKADFSDAVDVEGFSTSQSKKYDPDKTSYTFADDPHANVYYRVARDLRQDWGWSLGESMHYTAQHAAITQNSHVSLTLDSQKIQAILTWDTSGIWTHGATFTITRLNRTNNTSTEIDLDKEDYYKGKYIDSLITPCNEYYYTLKVKPADNSGFDTQKSFTTANSILPVNIGTISHLEASKGYFPDRTTLKWTSVGSFDKYIIKRKEYGSSDNYTQIAIIPGANISDVGTEDSKGIPGVYYQYMVVGAVNCNNEVKYSKDTLYAIGFRSPTGNIYGRVTYENGQAVKNVAVRLESQEGTKLGQSIYLNGSTNSYLKIKSLQVPFSDSAFTFEAWIKPDEAAPKNQVIFSRDGQYEIGFDKDGKLYFSYGHSAIVSGDYVNLNQSFVHITAIHHLDSLSIMLNDSILVSSSISFQAPSSADSTVYIGKKWPGNNFKGYIDEMRIWNIALTPDQVIRYYTSLLTGGEEGLVAYWRFDETSNNEFYDISHLGDKYNRNDGIMDPAEVVHRNITPTFDQLALKAFTDSTGNYMISGVPYTGVNGTTYKIIPLLGTHQFDPVSVNRLVSADAASFSVDFKDKSSFPVSGYVYYRNTTVPVGGVQFKIDGQYAQRSNGDIIATDPSGKFEISVPVGTHEVKAIKANHVFVNEGKITNSLGENLNYQAPVSERILTDSTTIRFIGRVGGGAIQEAYPLGHSLSKNNLGRNLSIAIQLPVTGKYKLNKGSADSSVIVDHLLPSDQTDSAKIHYTRVDYKPDTILIHPDSLTGEFAVDLIPEKFLVGNVLVTGWDDLLEGKPVTLDLSNKFSRQYSVNSYQDSVQNAKGGWDHTNYTDTVSYNDSYKFIKRQTPLVRIVQLDKSGKTLSYFGDTAYNYESFVGTTQTIPVVDNTRTEKEKYLFGYPVFTQNKIYHFTISAYEAYPFYDRIKPDGTKVIAQANGKNIVDEVPTQDGFVTINNKIRNGPISPDTVSLDGTGKANYDFSGGDPELTQGLKNFAASIRFGQATNVNWNWLGDPQLKGYLIGGKLTGTDFVTAGPDKLLAVLRDPPGSRSYTYMESGSTISSSNTYSGAFDQQGDETLVQKLGAELVTFTGVGVGTINSAVTSNGIGLGIHHEEHYTRTNTKEESTTLTTRFQTSDDPAFVGAPGDLYIGYSTNITYGQSNNITIIPRSEKKPADSVIYESSANSPYLVVRRSGINIGQQFGTLFAFPQQHLIKVLIPNLIKIRNSMLLPKGTTNDQAQQAANNKKAPVYVSKLDVSDPNFGKSNNDTTVFGSIVKALPFDSGKSYSIYFPESSPYRTDTIMILNQYVKQWEQRIADNEREKLQASLMQNYSFHAGNPIDYSEQKTHDTVTNNSFNIVISGSITNSTDVKIMGNGFSFTFNESVGTTQGGEFIDTHSSVVTHGFELAADGTDDYLSVDVNKASDGGFAFRTKGGVTGCPYEGASLTQYYQPGTRLGEPTQRTEVPVLSVDKPVVNDIPSSRKASYTLRLRNESEAQLPASFLLTYADVDSIKGAAIAIDGGLIGGSGRVIVVPYGETVTKVLTLTKGPDAMDYNNIPIILRSSCQYDPVGYQELIADTVFISAHFIPSCSDIHMKQPSSQWILNTAAPVNEQGKRYLPVTLDKFDVTNSLFDHIELEYKPSANSQWITVAKYYADSTKMKEADGEKHFITNAQEINYDLVMDDASFNDQQYDIRAESVCKLGPGNLITTPTDISTGLKDTYNPRLFGNPQPPNGILGVGEEIRLNFNETIADGLLTPSNFHVTGIRNGAIGDHSVSVQLDGKGDYLATEFEKNLAGKSVTIETWVLPNGKANGTIFSQGNLNKSMELAFTEDNHLQVMVGAKVLESDKPLNYKPGEWAHVALVYNAAAGNVSAFYNFEEVIHDAPVGAYDGIGHFEFGRSISKAGNFFAGKMHEVRVWSNVRTATALQENSLTRFSGAENGLMAYYPLNEGKGNTAFDKAHGANAKFIGEWSTPAGKAIKFINNGYVKISTTTTPVTPDMDYTMELWFNGVPGQTNAALMSNGKGDGTDPGGSARTFFLGFENGLLTYENNGFKVQADGNYLDNNWHHVAVAVNRNSGTSSLYVDGILKKYFDSKNLGGIASSSIYFGARAWYDKDSAVAPNLDEYFNGSVDEVRLWNTYLDQTLINKDNNVRLKGDELGLMFYYPFEYYFEFQNNKEMGFTLKDMKTQRDPKVIIPDAVALNATEDNNKAPVKDRGPVDNLQFSYVVNDDALIINMLEPKQAIDKTIVTFQVDGVRDKNGNTIVSPVTWSAYIDQNLLKWSDDELNLTKDLYAPMQFESYVVNNGGNIENFRLDNIPAWLTASPSSGKIDPKGKQKITFTVNKGLNVGAYDEIVYMRNDNDEVEALTLNLKVKGKEPDWKVNPADFQYNMTVYGKIRVDDIFSSNPDDILAAFVDGKCVGVAHNAYIADNDMWYVFLTVYNDSVQAGNIEFRIWDANNGKIYAGLPTLPIAFQNNAVAGSLREPVIFDGKELLIENMAINKGWNWISFNLVSGNLQNITAALAGGSWNSGDIVKHDVVGFDQYSRSEGWLGTLPAFDNVSLYKLRTNNAQTVSFSGTAVDVKNTPVNLKGNQWNYIGYLPQVNMSLKDALAGYEAYEGDQIKSQTGFAMYDARVGWVGSLDFLEPGKGYMMYRKGSQDTTFHYPAIQGILRLSNTNNSDMPIARLNRNQSPVENNYNYADNMTVLAANDKTFAPMPKDKIQVYAGTELMGEALMINNPVTGAPAYFFNISGKDAQPLHFEVERNGKVVAQTDAVMRYSPNGMLGNLKEPYMLSFGKPKITTGIFPNPFRDAVTIRVALTPGQHQLQMTVYDANGRMVNKYPKATVDGEQYEVIWNGRNAAGSECSPGVYFIHLLVDGTVQMYKVIKL